jgi:hypothetical protein
MRGDTGTSVDGAGGSVASVAAMMLAALLP